MCSGHHSAVAGLVPGDMVRRPLGLEPSGRHHDQQEASVQYRTLGGTGIEVSVLCLGTMMFGALGNPDESECHKMLHAALDAGVNIVDTADVYAFGQSEEFLGRALAGRRDTVVLATKGHNAMPGDP